MLWTLGHHMTCALPMRIGRFLISFIYGSRFRYWVWSDTKTSCFSWELVLSHPTWPSLQGNHAFTHWSRDFTKCLRLGGHASHDISRDPILIIPYIGYNCVMSVTFSDVTRRQIPASTRDQFLTIPMINPSLHVFSPAYMKCDRMDAWWERIEILD